MKTKPLYFTILLSILMVSCEEDVILDLAKIEKKLVVEATVSNASPMATVTLSYSQDFYDIPEYKLLTNATVVLETESGEKETLTLNKDNIYESIRLQPEYMKKYTLKIQVDGQEVETTTLLPPKVEITSVAFVPNPFRNNPDSLNIFVNVADQIGYDNYFRLRVNKIGQEPTGEYYLNDDTFGKDGTISMPVYFKNFTWGDTVIVELYNLNKEIFDYYSGLSENINGSFNSIAPGNPVSNMPDDVYGYFAGYSIDRDTIVAKKFPF